MADIQYIEEEYARAKVKEPNRLADATALKNAIIDATDEIDGFLRQEGYTGTLPLPVGDRGELFKFGVAHWVGAILYFSHGPKNYEAGEKIMARAQAILRSFLASVPLTEPIADSVAKPSTYQYSSKGDLKQTDLTDPLDLNEDTG